MLQFFFIASCNRKLLIRIIDGMRRFCFFVALSLRHPPDPFIRKTTVLRTLSTARVPSRQDSIYKKRQICRKVQECKQQYKLSLLFLGKIFATVIFFILSFANLKRSNPRFMQIRDVCENIPRVKSETAINLMPFCSACLRNHCDILISSIETIFDLIKVLVEHPSIQGCQS